MLDNFYRCSPTYSSDICSITSTKRYWFCNPKACLGEWTLLIQAFKILIEYENKTGDESHRRETDIGENQQFENKMLTKKLPCNIHH